MLSITIEPRSELAPSEQIAEQVAFAVASGTLAVGDRLPSVRALAVAALVNPNTVAKAYRQLEREGVVETRPGDGVFVASGARARCMDARNHVLLDRLRRIVDEARRGGVGEAELWHWFETCVAKNHVKETHAKRR